MTLGKNTVVQQFSTSSHSIVENWYIKKAKLKKKYPNLTDNDLRFDEVKNGMLWDELKIKFCLNKEELQKIVSAI
jgi:hypothetical protein